MSSPSITAAEFISDLSSIFASSSTAIAQPPPDNTSTTDDVDDDEFVGKAREALSLSAILESKAKPLTPHTSSTSMARTTSPLPASIVNGIARNAAGVVGATLQPLPANNGAALDKDEVEEKVALVEQDVKLLLARMQQAGLANR